MKHGLSESTVEYIHSVLRKYPQVKRAILYGSRAKGTPKRGSDIDLTLVGEDLTLEVLCRIMGEMEESPLPYKFDLSIFHQIDNPALREHIERIGLVFYERSPE